MRYISSTDLHGRSGNGLASALRQTPCLELTGDHRGTLSVGDHRARVHLEPGDWLRVEMEVEPSLLGGGGSISRRALELHRDLPSNLRFACSRAGAGTCLIADTLTRSVGHLPETIEEIRRGLAAALCPGTPEGPTSLPDARDLVAAALEELGQNGSGVVERDQDWEIRTRLRGTAVPVRVSLDQQGVRVHRKILKFPPDEPSSRAVETESLRFNDRLRLARISAGEDGLEIETVLHGGLLASSWLDAAARAVSVGYCHVRPNLMLLAENEGVARCYAEVILDKA